VLLGRIPVLDDLQFQFIQAVTPAVDLVVCGEEVSSFAFGVENEYETVEIDERTIVDQIQVVFIEVVVRVEESRCEHTNRLVDVFLEVLTQFFREDAGLVIYVVEEAVAGPVGAERFLAEEQVELLERFKLTSAIDDVEKFGQIDLIVGIQSVTRRLVVEPPLLAVCEDCPLGRCLLEIAVDLVAWVLEVAFLFPTRVELSPPSLCVGDGGRLLIEILAIESGICGLRTWEEAVVRTASIAHDCLFDLDRNSEDVEDGADEVSLQLGLIVI